MPRVTAANYLAARHRLADLWTSNSGAFGLLSYRDQRYLHDYFLLSMTLEDDYLLAYRAKISKDRPSLPQCAGRALRRLEVGLETWDEQLARRATSETPLARRRPTVSGIARPEIATDRVVQALLQVAKDGFRPDDKDQAA